MGKGRVVGAQQPAPRRQQTDEEEKTYCPLCIEVLDEAERTTFFPCPCGYQVCTFCFGRIKDQHGNLCPGCRTAYGPEKDVYQKGELRRRAPGPVRTGEVANGGAEPDTVPRNRQPPPPPLRAPRILPPGTPAQQPRLAPGSVNERRASVQAPAASGREAAPANRAHIGGKQASHAGAASTAASAAALLPANNLHAHKASVSKAARAQAAASTEASRAAVAVATAAAATAVQPARAAPTRRTDPAVAPSGPQPLPAWGGVTLARPAETHKQQGPTTEQPSRQQDVPVAHTSESSSKTHAQWTAHVSSAAASAVTPRPSAASPLPLKAPHQAHTQQDLPRQLAERPAPVPLPAKPLQWGEALVPPDPSQQHQQQADPASNGVSWRQGLADLGPDPEGIRLKAQLQAAINARQTTSKEAAALLVAYLRSKESAIKAALQPAAERHHTAAPPTVQLEYAQPPQQASHAPAPAMWESLQQPAICPSIWGAPPQQPHHGVWSGAAAGGQGASFVPTYNGNSALSPFLDVSTPLQNGHATSPYAAHGKQDPLASFGGGRALLSGNSSAFPDHGLGDCLGLSHDELELRFSGLGNLPL